MTRNGRSGYALTKTNARTAKAEKRSTFGDSSVTGRNSIGATVTNRTKASNSQAATRRNFVIAAGKTTASVEFGRDGGRKVGGK